MPVRTVASAAATAAGAVLLLATPAGAADVVQVRGEDSGTFVLGQYDLAAESPCTGSETAVSATGVGTLSHVGRVSVQQSECVLVAPDGTATFRAGLIRFTTPDGSTLSGSYTGTGALEGNAFSSRTTVQVTGSTGRLSQLTGVLTIAEQGTFTPMTFSGAITGTLSSRTASH